jgi:hypothetical protein
VIEPVDGQVDDRPGETDEQISANRADDGIERRQMLLKDRHQRKHGYGDEKKTLHRANRREQPRAIDESCQPAYWAYDQGDCYYEHEQRFSPNWREHGGDENGRYANMKERRGKSTPFHERNEKQYEDQREKQNKQIVVRLAGWTGIDEFRHRRCVSRRIT